MAIVCCIVSLWKWLFELSEWVFTLGAFGEGVQSKLYNFHASSFFVWVFFLLLLLFFDMIAVQCYEAALLCTKIKQLSSCIKI